ncbi:hypothetical protein KY362_04350 [Candidatus Woesearchaeota archaeon]|nr:hypothetical protein [Candidatus Woesearchaeota archaeon]
MTVIVGVESNKGTPGVVIGADRATVNGNLDIASYFGAFSAGSVNLSVLIGLLKEKGMERLNMYHDTKLAVSHERDTIIAHTGTFNEAHVRACSLLGDPASFLEDREFLNQLLFPLPVPGDTRKSAIGDYCSSFNLPDRIAHGHIPEIRRIFDFFAVTCHSIEGLDFDWVRWDRNYNAEFSEYLCTMPLQFGGPKIYWLLEVAITGTVRRREYFANGCGGEFAMEYLRANLGTMQLFGSDESKVRCDVTIDDAVDLVRGAVEYANDKSLFCSGFDYAILTPDGVETHFDDSGSEFSIPLTKMIDRRLARLDAECRNLKSARAAFEDMDQLPLPFYDDDFLNRHL